MYSIYPKFYDDFQCKANECRHSCCKGWEIDIDRATAQLYLVMDTPVGEKIRKHMGSRSFSQGASPEENQEYFFALNKENRCPFLQENGLCELIVNCGEDILCDICAMHPRFFTYYKDFELAGLGLCCEYSVELLLNSEEKLIFFIEAEAIDNNEVLNNKAGKYSKRTYVYINDVLQLIGAESPPEEYSFQLPENREADYYAGVLDIMAATEPIDREWTELVTGISKFLQAKGTAWAGQRKPELKAEEQSLYNKIFQYILYRQLENLTHYTIDILVEFARLSTTFILLAAGYTGDIAEAIRQWSAQIEYDLDNVALIYEKIV